MNTTAKLSAYGAALVLLAGAGWATGSAVGPLATASAAASGENGTMSGMAPAGAEEAGHGDAHSGTVADAATDQPGGLASSAGGYTLTPADVTLTPGTTQDLTFRITGPDGTAVTAFDVEHEKRMHLILVRRDTAGFQHLHPEMSPDGTWTAPTTVDTAGSYRAFADFVPTGGTATTLGVDLVAAGTFEPVVHAPSRVAQVDGYSVELAGDLVPGQSSPVTLTVTKDGVPVSDLQPYLGAYGHLVALRQGDLAYLHVHPEAGPAGPQIPFVAEVPSAGTYRLFLDFRHGGAVRTAEFTVPTTGAAPVVAPAPTDAHGEPGHGH
ncbi:hypothetical protein I4I84_05640 [Pseudonocardia sp. KRD-182]|uniref:hypothetical protein n=1 Tax=Pseudonocardia oceani TaxID=2792013 RepID=UPI001C4A1423|nr:hypothetical protein [Pseudonocardia oceani]MBW0108224.1 hypothetical protein [Pseudonocardia oceani]